MSLVSFYNMRAEEENNPASFRGNMLLADRRVMKQEHERAFQGKNPNFYADVRKRDLINLTKNILPSLKPYRTFW